MIDRDRLIDVRIVVLAGVAIVLGCSNYGPPDESGTGGAGAGPKAQSGGTGGSVTSTDRGTGGGADASADTSGKAGPSDSGAPALAAWESACIGWLRASCAKDVTCSIPPGDDCAKSDLQLRDICRGEVNKDGCSNPDPKSFDECRQLDETETCNMFCAPPQRFCFDFCFFSCLPAAPAPMDAGAGAVPDALDQSTDELTDGSGVDDGG